MSGEMRSSGPSVLLMTILWSVTISATYASGKNRDDDGALYLLLLGKSGHGKSALGNHLLGTKVFESRLSPNSVTKDCQKEKGAIGNTNIVVVDTPGTMDTELDFDEFLRHFSVAATLTPNGYHAILLVFSSITRVTAEEKEAIKVLERILGESFFEHVIFVFTYENVFAANIDPTMDPSDAFHDYLNKLDSEMRTFIAKSGRRCVLMNPVQPEASLRRDTNLKILGLVEDLVNGNRESPHRNEYFDIIQKMKEAQEKQFQKDDRFKSSEEREWEKEMREREIEFEKEKERMRQAEREREWEREQERMREKEREREWVREKERMSAAEREREWEWKREMIAERERRKEWETEKERAIAEAYEELVLNTGIRPLDFIANFVYRSLRKLYNSIVKSSRKLLN